MKQLHDASPFGSEIGRNLAILEEQLSLLDELGATLAAAHLDSAIQQLRRDQFDLDQNSLGCHGSKQSSVVSDPFSIYE